MADYGIWQGLEKATGNMANTGMKLMEFQANRAHQQAVEADSATRLKMAQAQHNLLIEEAEKKKAMYERPMNIKTQPEFLSLTPEGQKNALNYFVTNKYTDENGIGKSGSIMEGMTALTQSKDLFKTFMGPEVKAKEAGITAAWQAFVEAKATGDPKKMQTARAFYDGLRMEYDAALGGYSKHLDALEKHEQALELKGVEQAGSLTDDIKEYNLARVQGEKRTFTEWLRENKKAGSTRVSVETRVGQDTMTELGKEMSKDLVSQRKDVQGAVSSLNNLKEAERLISGGVITGTGAEYLVNFGNFLSSRMGINLAKTPVENTQAFTATMGNQVGQIIKQFGSGTGLSDADREYAEKIVGGKITLTEGAIKKLMAINKKGYENVVRNYNKRADQAMKKPGADQLPYDLRIEYDFDEKLPAGLKAGW